MFAVLITLTPGHRNEFFNCQNAKGRIAVHSILDVKTHWISTLELIERAFRLRQFTREWLNYLKYSDYRPLFTTQDDWTILKYLMEVLWRFQYWTLWISNKHTVTLHHVTRVYNDMFNHMDGVMRALAKKKSPWMEDLFFTVKLARLKLTKYEAEVTPSTGMLLIAARILDDFRKLRTSRKWDKGIDIHPEDETSYTNQCQEFFLMNVENENCAKHRSVAVNKHESLPRSNLVPSETVSGSCQSSFDPYDLSSDDEEHVMPNNEAETTRGRSDHTAHWLTAARLSMASPPAAPKNRRQINSNLNDYHSDPMEICSTFWLPDITD